MFSICGQNVLGFLQIWSSWADASWLSEVVLCWWCLLEVNWTTIILVGGAAAALPQELASSWIKTLIITMIETLIQALIQALI